MKTPSQQFVSLPPEILEADLSNGAMKALLGLLSFRNRKTGQCNPKIAKLCERLGGVSDVTARRWLRQLRRAGIVEATKEHGKSNSYRIDMACAVKNDRTEGAGCAVKNDRTCAVKNDRSVPPLPYMNQKNIEPVHTPAAATTCREPAAAAAPKPTQTQKRPPASEGAEAARFRIVRDSLNGLADAAHIPYPDDDLVRRVLAIAPAAAGHEISAALVRLWKGGQLAKMRGWGFVLLKLGDCVRRGAA